MNEAQRLQRRNDLLASVGWSDATIKPLAEDASFRSYQRLEQNGETLVLMDAPPPHEDVAPFVAVGRWLCDNGYAAPEISAVDAEAGYLVIEDLGDDLFIRALAAQADSHADEEEMYAAAVDVMAGFQGKSAPDFLQPYSLDFLITEVLLFTDWYAPCVAGVELDPAQASDFEARWRAALTGAMRVGPPVVVLRDYHAENLLWLPDRVGLQRVGLIDFQDALVGSVTYDLTSLLKDIRRDVPDALVEQMIGRYLAQPVAAGLDEAEFRAAFAVIGAQRLTKIIGIFSRLSERDGKPAYLDYLPRLWQLLAAELVHPALADVADWFDAAFPPEMRT